jgi:hypothetical protein
MGEFRIGRKFAQHSYPESRFGDGAFARNFASGPPTGEGPTPIVTTGTPVSWETIESGAPPGVNVPITPHVTGRIRIIATIVVASVAGAGLVGIGAVIDGTPISTPQSFSAVVALGVVTVSFVLDVAVGFGPHTVQIRAVAGADNVLVLQPHDSTLDIQELGGTVG